MIHPPDSLLRGTEYSWRIQAMQAEKIVISEMNIGPIAEEGCGNRGGPRSCPLGGCQRPQRPGPQQVCRSSSPANNAWASLCFGPAAGAGAQFGGGDIGPEEALGDGGEQVGKVGRNGKIGQGVKLPFHQAPRDEE